MRAQSVKLVLRLVTVAALAGAALAVVAPGPAVAAGVPCQRSYTDEADVAIPNPGFTTAPEIDVPDDGLVVTDVDVAVNITHPEDVDLELFLDSHAPDASFRHGNRLVNRDGAFGDNYTGTVFDDEATTPVSWSDAPFTGRFKPDRPLSVHDGDVGGFYRLVLQDDDGFAGTNGTLLDWSLTFRYQSCDFDSDGVEDHADSCLGVTAHTATGCPLTTRTVTAKYKHGAFKGALASPVAGCTAGQGVTIWKSRSGADKVVGMATTLSDGSYKLKRAKHVGRYYATSGRVAVTDVAECPAVQSATFRIR
ncbi:MAG: hypothetical protein JF565_08985 [Propionibacteriales bacterium]|nr:hypothetical protein [Propionibacteriales bacterium]